jgi:hypothetical protein
MGAGLDFALQDATITGADPALADMGDLHAQHLTESDVEDEAVGTDGADEDEEMQGPPSDGHLHHPLGSHQYSDNTPPTKRMRRQSSASAGMVLDPAVRALTKSVRWFVYGKSRVCKETFEDDYWEPRWRPRSVGATMMGATMASSFCERINSCANLVCTKGNSVLSDDEIDKVVTLRMNREFMEYMRTNYPEVIKSMFPKYGTLVTADDLREERHKEEEVDDIF